MGWQEIVLQQIVNGLILGSFIVWSPWVIPMVYGIIQLLNFAHGDVYMTGAFVGFAILGLVGTVLGTGWGGILVAMLLSMLVVGLMGVLDSKNRLSSAAFTAAAEHSDRGHGRFHGFVQWGDGDHRR